MMPGLISVLNIVILFQPLSVFNLSALAVTVIGIAILLYFLSKDLASPNIYARGWRYQKRIPVQLPIQIDGTEFQTTDISAYGFYAELPHGRFNQGQELPVRILLGENTFELTGIVARIDRHGAGFAFRGLDATKRLNLHRAIQQAVPSE